MSSKLTTAAKHGSLCVNAYKEVMYAYKAVLALQYSQTTQTYYPGAQHGRHPSSNDPAFKLADFLTDVENAIASTIADRLTLEEWKSIKSGGEELYEAMRKIGSVFLARGISPVKSYMKVKK